MLNFTSDYYGSMRLPLEIQGVSKSALQWYSKYSRLSIIRAGFNRFAAQPRQCIFKEKILFSVSITFV
jgi:hypothetical protein